jgi:hypothetical protein
MRDEDLEICANAYLVYFGLLLLVWLAFIGFVLGGFALVGLVLR